MTMLSKIGNSQGVVIPKAYITDAKLSGKELEFKVVKEGLLIKATNTSPRADWQAQIEKALAIHGHDIDQEWLDAPLTDDKDWQWQANK